MLFKLNQLGTEFEVSSIGLGCVTFGREIDDETSFGILDHALERGINLLDTAEGYHAGASERVLGAWMNARGARDQVVLATKVAPPLGKQRVIQSTEESLERLQTDRERAMWHAVQLTSLARRRLGVSHFQLPPGIQVNTSY